MHAPEREAARPGRVLALDLGTRRIGVAVSDAARRLALPRGVLERCGDVGEDHRRIAGLVDELEAGLVVVGLPLGLDGREGPAARAVRAELDALAAALAVPVVPLDERLSTREATRRTVEARAAVRGEVVGRRSGGRRRRSPGARRPVDALAAAVVLQRFLDAGGPAA
ncbi:MAG TPA: Holliday junction resolvase RuvX [Acidimicrobiales bacterium]|nr:Holliday junction resolvase RuvX [Acidimicrobiales bacterium]